MCGPKSGEKELETQSKAGLEAGLKGQLVSRGERDCNSFKSHHSNLETISLFLSILFTLAQLLNQTVPTYQWFNIMQFINYALCWFPIAFVTKCHKLSLKHKFSVTGLKYRCPECKVSQAR